MGLMNKIFRKDKPSAQEGQPVSDKEVVRQFRLGIATLVKHEQPDVRAGLALQNVLIITASQFLEAVKEHVKTTDEKERSTKYYELASEFFTFLVHLANRRMYMDHGEPIGKRWQQELVPKYIEAFVKQWCVQTSPSDVKYAANIKIYEDFRERLCSELFHNLNVAETEYTPCRGLLAEDNKIFTGDSLFSKLARNITQIIGTHNFVVQSMIYFGTFEIFLRIGFTDWVKEAANELAAKPVAA